MASEIQLDKLDRTILQHLLEDARTPYLEIARACNVSGATVHLRVQKLEKLGLILGSRLIIDYKKLGLGIRAFLGVYLGNVSDFPAIFEHLKTIPEVVESHYTTGSYAIFSQSILQRHGSFKGGFDRKNSKHPRRSSHRNFYFSSRNNLKRTCFRRGLTFL